MKSIPIVLLAALTVVCVRLPAARGAIGNLLGKLPFSDTGPDNFGTSLAIDGNNVIVGAPGYEFTVGGTTYENAGSAFIYDLNSGSLIRQLVPSTLGFLSSFGYGVAIHGNTALVGVPGEFVSLNDDGAAHLYDVVSGNELATLHPSDSGDGYRFGLSVALNDTTAIVGSNTGDHSGAVYLFNSTTGTQLGQLVPNDASPGKIFGSSVAVSGNTAIIGARHDSENASRAGAAYLFNVATQTQLAKLLPTDPQSVEDDFGSSVAISGNFAVVGVPNDDDGGTQSGSAYIFNVVTGQQIAKLLPSDPSAFENFGFSVSISGNTILIGANGDDRPSVGSGSAYLFDLVTHKQIAKLVPTDQKINDPGLFGLSVAVSGNTFVVGAPKQGLNDTGAVYVYATNAVPEPSTLVSMVFVGLAGTLFSRWR